MNLGMAQEKLGRRRQRRPGQRPRAGRRRAPQRQGRPGRAARPGPRHPPAGARHRPGRRAGHAGRQQRDPGRGCTPTPGPAQRRRSRPSPTSARPSCWPTRPSTATANQVTIDVPDRDGTAGAAGRRRRRRRRGPGPRQRPGRAGRSGSRTVDGRLDMSSPPGGPTAGHRRAARCTRDRARWHAGRDRRGRRPAPGGPGPAARPTAATRSCAAVADARRAARRGRRAPARRRPWSTSGCRRRTPTRACAPPSSCRRDHPGTGVLVFSQYIETRYAARLLGRQRGRRRLPAQGPGRRRGRVHRRAGPGGGRRHRARPRGGQPAAAAPAGRGDGLATLTPREREVLALMAEGRSNAGDRRRARGLRAARWRSTWPASSPSSACRRRTSDNRRVLAVLRYLGGSEPGPTGHRPTWSVAHRSGNT